MNYLGHLLLSGNDETLMIGNFLADRLNLKESQSLPQKYQPGINYHRHIDHTTDAHPYFKHQLKLMYPTYGKYSSVVLDILIDFLLSMNWHLFTDESYPDFTSRIYDIITRHVDYMPLKAQDSIKHMVKFNWMDTYTSWEGMTDVFSRLDRRTTFKSEFVNKISFLKENEGIFGNGFPDFFNDVKKSCDQFLIEKNFE